LKTPSFGQTARRGAIGYEKESLGAFQSPEQPQHGWVKMDAVGDYLHVRLQARVESGTDQSGLAMMQGTHGVEAVGNLCCAETKRPHGAVVGGGRVTECDAHTVSEREFDNCVGTRNLRSNSEQANFPASDFHDAAEFSDVCLLDKFLSKAAALERIDVGTLKVDSENFSAGLGRPVEVAHKALELRERAVMTSNADGGEQSGAATVCGAAAYGLDGADCSFMKIPAETSLDMNIHETRRGDETAKVEGITLRTGGGRSAMNCCNRAVRDFDLNVAKMLARRAEIAAQETPDVP
jgi:hypothetical protein